MLIAALAGGGNRLAAIEEIGDAIEWRSNSEVHKRGFTPKQPTTRRGPVIGDRFDSLS